MQQQQQAAHQDQPPAGALGAKWQDMPTELVAAFLQHVPCQDRLTQAAMVSKQWHKAAHRATQDICAAIATSQLPDITAWLAKHGRSLQSLDIESSRDEEEDRIHGCLHLPLAHLPQLTSLTLSLRPTHILHLPAPPWLTLRDTPTATPALMMPKVEALRLHDFFLDSLTTLMQLSHLSALTELQLLHIHTPPSSTKQLSTAIATLLKSLPLAVVALDSVDLDESAWTHLSSATSLLRLYVENIPSAQAVRHVFNALPAGITKLCVDDRQVGQSRFPAITSSLTCGSALQELRLVEIGLRPHSLDGLTQLRVLHLENCKVLSGLHEAQADVDDGAALLAAVAEMKQVETLLIESDDVVLFSVEPQHLAALTASTNLKTLHVCSWDSLLPPDALKFMFAGNRLLPELQHLGLSCQLDVLYAELDSASTPPADLGLVCASCRGLTSLLLHNVLGPGILSANLPPLCASLSIGGEAIDDAAAAVLCNNTQLRHLGIWGAPALTNAGLEHVTRLANLEFVGIFGWDGRTPEVVPPGQGYLYKGEEGYNFLQLAVSDEVSGIRGRGRLESLTGKSTCMCCARSKLTSCISSPLCACCPRHCRAPNLSVSSCATCWTGMWWCHRGSLPKKRAFGRTKIWSSEWLGCSLMCHALRAASLRNLYRLALCRVCSGFSQHSAW